MPHEGSWLLHTAWAGLPGHWVLGSLAVFTVWWGIGAWLYWGYGAIGDEGGYLDASRLMIDGTLNDLARGVHGTMFRPYIYSFFLRVIFPIDINIIFGNRLYIACIQTILYLGVSFRLAQFSKYYGDKTAKIIIVSLLCNPFSVISLHEILTENLSISVFLLLISSISAAQNRNLFFIYMYIRYLILFILYFVRSSYLPLLLYSLIIHHPIEIIVNKQTSILLRFLLNNSVILLSLYSIFLNIDIHNIWLTNVSFIILILTLSYVYSRTHKFIFYSLYIILFLVISYPQFFLMNRHLFLNGTLPDFFGASDAQLYWGTTIGKVIPSAIQCGSIPSGMLIVSNYFTPVRSDLLDSFLFSNLLTYYFYNPTVILFHLYGAITHEYLGTYITRYNMYIFIFSIYLTSFIICTLLIYLRPCINILLAIYKNQLTYIPVSIAILWLQNSLVAVESRFGIIPFMGLFTLFITIYLDTYIIRRITLYKFVVISTLSISLSVIHLFWIIIYSPLGAYYHHGCA